MEFKISFFNRGRFRILILKIKGIDDIKAFEEGEKDDFVETDMKYGTFSPSLCEYLQEYVEKNKDCIFD